MTCPADGVHALVEDLTLQAATVSGGASAATLLVTRTGGLRVVAVFDPAARCLVACNGERLSAASILTTGRQFAASGAPGDALPTPFDGVFSPDWRAAVVTPLRSGDEVIGAIVVARPEPGPWDDAALIALTNLAARSTISIRAAHWARRRDLQAVELERISCALRAQSHEQANHTHAINALIAMGEVEEARRFGQQLVQDDIAVAPGLENLDDSLLTALLSAEHALAERRGLRLTLEVEDSIATPALRVLPEHWAALTAALLECVWMQVVDDDAARRPIALSIGVDGADSVRLTAADRGAGVSTAPFGTGRTGEGVAVDEREPSCQAITVWHSLLLEAARAAGATVSVDSSADRTVTSIRIPHRP